MTSIRKYALTLLAVATLPAAGQDIYKVEDVTGSDLNGTARFVGMGGAMSGLGADLSVMGTNPAGIGLYRRSDVALTGSVSMQPSAEEFYNIRKSRASFDQIGFVYVIPMNPGGSSKNGSWGEGGLKYVNVGFNYQKRRNFKNFTGVSDFSLNGMSQTWQMMDLCYGLDLSNGSTDRELTTPLALAGYETYLIDYDENGDFVPRYADSYNYKRVKWGGIQQYDFNLSFNYNDQIYGGLTFGMYNIDAHGYTDYGEMLIDYETGMLHEYYLNNEESLTGYGYDVKFGVLLRPIETSPFRMGVSVHTPTFYDLKASSYLYMNSPLVGPESTLSYTDYAIESGVNEYKIRTPWKFNISMATTVGTNLALDAEYEYCDLTTASISYPDYYYADWYGWGDGHKDRAQNEEIKRFMKPVSTFRIGAEARVAQGTYVRVGYNHVTAPMKKDAYLNLFTASPSYYYSTNTDYINLGAINRLTAGLGIRGKHYYADFAYQYQAQKGDLYTFHIPETDSEQNRLTAAKVDMNRHNLMLTVGYKF